MNWQQLLSPKRLCCEYAPESNRHRSPFERDLDRIIFSSAFRRLQDKTQVHPLTPSDYVRTRLTHSLEVSSVGRSLGVFVGNVLIERYELPGITPQDFGAITSAACLAHDIGNPPFGHAGEDAIQDWFSRNPQTLDGLTPRQKADILHFEGNAQGFRTIATTQNYDNPGGLQLTSATLAAFTKYPRASDVASLAGDVGGKKYGFFETETALFQEVAQTVGLLPRRPGEDYWARHPLAFLLEAADDICYSIIDFEDGYKLGKLSFDEAETGFRTITGDRFDTQYREIIHPDKKISFLRGKAIGVLVTAAAEVFLDNEAGILDGTFRQPLLELTPQQAMLAQILTISRDKVYFKQHQGDEKRRAGEVVGGLLESFLSGEASDYVQTLSPLHPVRQVFGEDNAISAYARLQTILDYISGMTDTFAVELLKKLRRVTV